MSVVSSIIILTSILEDDCLPAINSFFGDGPGFKCISDFAGGRKAMQAFAFAGAFNALDNHAFFDHLRRIQWADRDNVRVFFNSENDQGWTEIDISARHLDH